MTDRKRGARSRRARGSETRHGRRLGTGQAATAFIHALGKSVKEGCASPRATSDASAISRAARHPAHPRADDARRAVDAPTSGSAARPVKASARLVREKIVAAAGPALHRARRREKLVKSSACAGVCGGSGPVRGAVRHAPVTELGYLRVAPQGRQAW